MADRHSRLVCFVTVAALVAASAPLPLAISINASAPQHTVANEYISFNLDYHYDGEEWPAWRSASVINMTLSGNADLSYLAAALAPAFLRVGGSEGDLVQYVLPGFPCNSTGGAAATFCLTQDRWAQINEWARTAGLRLAFGLNAMAGRMHANESMDLANVDAFLGASAAAGLDATNSLAYLEFGNEIQTKTTAAAYAADVIRVKALIDTHWASVPASARPQLVANDENPDANYWRALLPLIRSYIGAASWHMYTGYGLDPDLNSKALNASWLDGSARIGASQVAAAHTANYTGAIWVGETALAWHSGRNGTTNTFFSCPWYLIQLGALAHTHTVQCRQTLWGGYYELVDKATSSPNPDYWVAILWKRTMGTGVLTASIQPAPAAAPSLRVFAHCAAAASGGGSGHGVTLAFANLSPDSSYALNVSAGAAALAVPRLEYMLAPAGGDMGSRIVSLNGVALTYGGPGHLDPATPNRVTDPSVPLILAPHTVGFVVWPEALNAC